MPSARRLSRHSSPDADRTQWFLAEHGRFPTVDELNEIRTHLRPTIAEE